MIQEISITELKSLSEGNPSLEIVDVRTPREYLDAHVPGAINIPFDTVQSGNLGRSFSKSAPLYIICHAGVRSLKAAQSLSNAGYEKLYSVAGGTQKWIEAGLPIVRSSSSGVSMERQVRITAGGLVLLGVLLSWFLNPLFVLISAFVGAGLMYSGITNTCGMAMFLMKAPWNQSKAPDACTVEAR